jgi:hypothetical protein
VHNTVHHTEVGSDLQQVIDAWPGLPEHIKQAIKTLVETAGK